MQKHQVEGWLQFKPASGAARKFLVSAGAEDTRAAQRLAETISKHLIAHESVELNFQNIPVCTQSYVHALLFQPLRLAWALKTPIFVIHAQPAVRSALELLENYALAG